MVKIKKIFRKIFNKKINLVFVCHRPNVWGSLKTVFEACNNDENFNVTIVTIPNKKQLPDLGLDHEIYESEGAEDFFKDYPCKVINGYDYNKKKWFNLKSLKPNYIFFQQPYNITRHKLYRSNIISKYAKLLYVPYYAYFFDDKIEEECCPIDFFKDLYCVYIENKDSENFMYKLKNKYSLKTNISCFGFPRYDNLDHLKNISSNIWNYKKELNKKRIIWTPRWCTDEGNCNFFEYKDFFIQFAEENINIDFIFRPHPQAFLNWNATGELPEFDANNYINRYINCKNAKIDDKKEYLTTFYSSDIMVSDVSSVIPEYFLTGKPIIYCHKKDTFNTFSRKISEGFYWVTNEKELKSTLEMLIEGIDPLFDKRQELIKNNFYINLNGTGQSIKEHIKEDFYGI